MKNWRGGGGNGQLRGMQEDIEKLQVRLNGCLLITSINPQELTDGNFDYLLTKLNGLDGKKRQDYRFTTEQLNGRPTEFWIAGWPVLKRSQPNLERVV